MIIAQQVKHAMDDKPAHTFMQALIILDSLPQSGVHRNYNIPEFLERKGGKSFVRSFTKGKREYVGGLIFISVLGVKPGNFLIVGQEKADGIVSNSTLIEQPVGELFESFVIDRISGNLVLNGKIGRHEYPLLILVGVNDFLHQRVTDYIGL
jgi:hypothetical protein